MSRLKHIIAGSFLLSALVLSEVACSNGGQETETYPPDQFGTFSVGLREFELYDSQRERSVFTKVWYPAKKPPRNADPFYYLELLEGRAYKDLELDKSGAPYPLILFSHGNQGLGMQSFTLTEHLASHGFVVVAPNHEGNTIFDNPSDEEVAQISLDRPLDIVYAMEQIISDNAQPENDFYAVIDLGAIGISGHSFGGYTTILLAGADVDVSAAQTRCDAGIPGDIFCPYLAYWDSEENVKRPEGAAVFKAALALAHGGYAAFGDEGLAKVDMPLMLIGGSLDDFTFNELRPTYDALPLPKYKIEIEKAGHMSFTDICRAELPVPELDELCDPEVYLDIDRAFFIINVYATAYFRYYLKNDQAMAAYLGSDYAAGLPEVSFEAEQ